MMTQCWIIDLGAAGDQLEAAQVRFRLLSDDDAVAGQRRQARIALRLAIMRAHGIDAARRPFDIGPEGKPEITGAGLQFSLSHSGDLAAVATCDAAPIGIDIEQFRPLRMDAAHRLNIIAAAHRLTSFEHAEGGSEHRAIAAWTHIEAVAKTGGVSALRLLSWLGGRPLAAHLPRYHLDASGALHIDAIRYGVRPVPAPDAYAAAICVPFASPQFEMLDPATLLSPGTAQGA